MLDFENDRLIEKCDIKEIISKNFLDEIINIIPIFMKKTDFLRTSNQKNVILSKMPFVGGEKIKLYVEHSITKFGLRHIVNNYLSYMKYDKKNEHKVLYHIRHRIHKWIEYSFFPLTLVRVLIWMNSNDDTNEITKVLSNIEFITDYQCRCKFFYPKALKDIFNETFIYFAGCVYGDGSIDSESYISVYDGHPDKEKLKYSKLYLTKLSKKLHKKLGIIGVVRKDKKYNLYYLEIGNKWFVRYFCFIFSISSGRKTNLKLPIILQKNKKVVKYFWRGLFDSDGGVSSTHQAVSISSSCRELLEGFKEYLKNNRVNCKLLSQSNKYGKWFQLYILASEIHDFCKVIGSSHPLKQKIFAEILNKGPSDRVFKGINKSTITQEGTFNLSLIENRHKSTKFVRLPIKPSKELMKLARFVRPKNESSIFVRRSDASYILTNEEVEMISNYIEKIFGVKKVFENLKSRVPYFYSVRLAKFFSTFFNYEKPWKSQTPDEFINEWNKILVI
jgi:hypothetical protein